MARQPNITQAKTKFLVELKKARNMYSAFDGLPRRINPRATTGIHPKHIHKARELVFLGVVGAWEEFLEQCLVRYAMGTTTQSGYGPVMIAHPYRSTIDAYRAISGIPTYNPASNYISTNNLSWLVRAANRLFSTHSFRCLAQQANLINAASNVRNRIAHNSSKSRAAFVGTAQWFLHGHGNPLAQGFSPGALLGKTANRNFATSIIQQNITHFEAFLQLFEVLSNQVVP